MAHVVDGSQQGRAALQVGVDGYVSSQHPRDEAGLQDESMYRRSLHEHHDKLLALHDRVEHIHDAVTDGKSHDQLKEATGKLQKDVADVYMHYMKGPHHPSHWRNPGDHHKRHHYEEHTIASSQTTTAGLAKHPFDGGYDPALHHEHGLLSSSARGQYDRSLGHNHHTNVHGNGNEGEHPQVEAGLQDESMYRRSLHEHHDKLLALHDRVEHIHDAVTDGKSHDQLKEATGKLQKDVADVYMHYMKGPHHPSHWRNPGDHHKRHHYEEHTIASSQTTTAGLAKHPFDGGYDPALHHEHGLLSSSARGQYDRSLGHNHHTNVHGNGNEGEHPQVEAGLQDESMYRRSLHEHHDKLLALHDRVEHIHDAVTDGKSHDQLKEATGKLQKDVADVYMHYMKGPHHPSHWRNPGDHHKRHHYEEHTIASSQTTTAGLAKHPFDGGYDPALHHEHGLLSSSARGQYDRSLGHNHHTNVHGNGNEGEHPQVEAGLQDESMYRRSLHEHHDKLLALHDRVEHIHDAVTDGKSHDQLKEATGKLQKDVADVYMHYMKGPHHPSHWRNPGDHHKRHHYEEHTIASSQTTTAGLAKHPFDGGYDPALHHEHGLLSSSARGQYGRSLGHNHHFKRNREVVSDSSLSHEDVVSLQRKVALQLGVDGYVSVVRDGQFPRSWRVCAGCSKPVKVEWFCCPECETPGADSKNVLKMGWARCQKKECAAPVHSDWQVCPTCGTGVPIKKLGPAVDWGVCRECKRSLIRPGWHSCPGCQRPAPSLRTPRLPLLCDMKVPMLRGNISSTQQVVHDATDSERQFSPEFLLTTTPRYWDKKIREIEIKHNQIAPNSHTNPYATLQRLNARPDEAIQGWTGPSKCCIPPSLDSLRIYEIPYPRKSSFSMRQKSTGSSWSMTSRHSTKNTALSQQSSVESAVERRNNCASIVYSKIHSPRHEHSFPSLPGSPAYLRRQSSSESISSKQRHLLDGHSVPGKLWRKNSTFRDLAKMRISVEVPEMHDGWLRGGVPERGPDRQVHGKEFSWNQIHKLSMNRQKNLKEQITDAMAADLTKLEAAEDFLEVRRDGLETWFTPNPLCLRWSEQQVRLAAEKSIFDRKYAELFGENSVLRRWYRLSKKIIHWAVAKRFNVLRIEYDAMKVVFTQRCARRFLQRKRARANRAAMWNAQHRAATVIQSIVRQYRDAQFCGAVRKYKLFLEKNRNVFVAHKAFVRAKREYTGMIEPPCTAAAFANMGDASGAAEHESDTLSFVDFCKLLSNHLERVASCPSLARTTSSAILRVSSGEKTGSTSFVAIKRSQSLEKMLIAMTPFSQAQENVLRIAEATARLFYLYDKDRLGVLSEKPFWRFRRELSLSTGIEINRKDATCALRWARTTGGIDLPLACALYVAAKDCKISR